MPSSSVPFVPHLVAISCSKPCQAEPRPTLELGTARYFVGHRTVTSEPARAFARKVSYVAVRLISVIDFTVLSPPTEPEVVVRVVWIGLALGCDDVRAGVEGAAEHGQARAGLLAVRPRGADER